MDSIRLSLVSLYNNGLDNMINTYLSLEYIIMLSLFIFVLALFSVGSVFENIKRDEKKKEPYKSRRQKLREYNKKERQNK